MLVNPGIRRSLSGVGRVANSAGFFAPLTKSLILNRGTGSPTFTRATTATITDHEGVLRTAISGEARFQGARRVANLLTATETLSTQSPTVLTGTHTLSFSGTGSITYSGAAAGTLNGTGVGNRVQATFATTAGTLTCTVTGSCTQGQLENVTGQSVQTAGEYVSVGVLSSPYHGAGVDGVKYFPTLPNGLPISSSTAKYAQLIGVANSDFSTPDSVTSNVLGDIDVRAEFQFVTYTPASGPVEIVSKDNGSTDQGLFLMLTTAALPQVYFTDSGGTLRGPYTCGAAFTTAIPDGTRGALRMTRSASTGVITWYTAANIDGLWTQLGSPVTGVAGNLFDGPASVWVGHGRGGTLSPLGKVYRAQIYNGINGTLAVNFNANDYQTGTTWTASTTGETWTINNSASIFGAGASAPFDAKGPKGFISEGSRQNLCTKSQQFDAWTTVTGGAGSLPVVTADQAVAPDGTTTADKVVFAAPGVGDQSFVTSPSMTVTATSVYTGSFYVKAFGAGDIGKVLLTRNVAGSGYTTVTLTADWQRVGSTETAVAASATLDIGLRPTIGGSSGTVSCYLWGAQLELGSFASTYIPTTTVAVTRNADVLTYPSVGNVSTTAGWMSCEYSVPAFYTGVNYRPLQADDGTENNRIQIAYDSSGTNQNFAVVVGGVAQAAITGTRSTASKSAGSYAANNFNAAFNGAAGTQDTSGTVPTVTTIRVGNNSASGEYLFGSIKNVRIGQVALSSSQLAAITT